MRWRDFTRMPGIIEKGTHRVLARDYLSDSWLVRFWQYLAYFSNKDYRNHETVLTETTRTKLGTRRLNFFSFLVKCWKWTFIFNCEPGGPGTFKKSFTPGATFSGPMPGQIAFDFLRTFARKSSNIDFFLKLSPVWDYGLLMSKMLKNLGVTEFVSEIWCSKDHPKSEKSGFVTAYG